MVLQYGMPPGYVTVMRGGPLPRGRVVQTEGQHLRWPFETPDDAFFFLDTDASWADPGGGVPPFHAAEAMEIFDRLHEQCHRLFHEAVEERFVNEVLRRPHEDSGEVAG